MSETADIIVVGGGLVGLGTALRLLESGVGKRVRVLEKEAGVGRHQSTHNSGVLHCGLYYKPGSIKARMAVNGIREMTAFCQQHGVKHEICGKLVVATDAAEVERLKELQSRGTKNGLEGLRWLNAEEMREIEPNVAGLAALRVPQEGIVDYAGVCAAMVQEITRLGGEVITGAKVEILRQQGGEWVAVTTAGAHRSKFLVNCAGLHSDRVCELAGEEREVRIVPFRGEYYQLRKEREHLVKHLIYPVPDPKFPFLGVHFTRMIHGGVEAGPNAVLAFAREGYRKQDINVEDLADALTFGGLWKFMAQYPSMCWSEIQRSFSQRLFCESLQKLVPAVQESDLEPGGAGVRAQAMGNDGTLVQDFSLVCKNQAVHVLNAPSPAATASLAIGGEVANLVANAYPR
jgi:L-2-hydroxyglutarate oxidase